MAQIGRHFSLSAWETFCINAFWAKSPNAAAKLRKAEGMKAHSFKLIRMRGSATRQLHWPVVRTCRMTFGRRDLTALLEAAKRRLRMNCADALHEPDVSGHE